MEVVPTSALSSNPLRLKTYSMATVTFRYFAKRALNLDKYNIKCVSGLYNTIKLFCTHNSPNNKHSNENDDDRKYENLVKHCFLYKEQNCFIIQPYIKWGPKKERDITAQSQIAEAASLISTMPGWKVSKQVIVPLENFDKKSLFGTGAITNLKQQARQQPELTAVFLNISKLRIVQVTELENIFGLAILDRHKVVMHILRAHATSKHAKLQFSLAEIPYLRSRLKYLDTGTSENWETRHKMLEEREQKVRNSIKKLRTQRELFRNNRKSLNYPVVAFVGYTNSGKTSLIKALTGDQSLKPKDQFFATLDVTMHAGVLPSSLKVLYVDTVGFISNIPTDLIECFVATIEDAMLADIIVHVQDVSHENMPYQKKHVDIILDRIAKQVGSTDISERVISVGNKWDSIHNLTNPVKDMILVSAKTTQGLDVLRHKIESEVLKATGRRILIIRVPSGGQEMRWLYKNATVIAQLKDTGNSQFIYLRVIINKEQINQFHQNFIANK